MRPDDYSLDNCLKCALCNAACPMLGAYPEYPGPKRLGPELERLRREGVPTDTEWLEYCLGCHRCDVACPHQVGVSEMIARAKASHRKPLIRAMRDWWFARPGLIGRLSTIQPALSNFALSMKPARLAMSIFMRITPLRSFPKYTRAKAQKDAAVGGTRPRVLLFPGCSIRYNEPELGSKVVELLERNGFAAEVASTECCGVPASANGDASQAQAAARANVKLLASQVDSGVRIVTACSSCGHRIKTAFGGVLDEDNALGPAARKIAANTYDLAELLMEQSNAGRLNTDFQPTNLRMAYHAPCHQKSQGIGRPWFHLLRQIPGVTIEDLDAGCCGISGTFGFKQEKYKASMDVGRQLFNGIGAADPEFVTTECATCQMQIEHGTSVKTIHPAEVLLRAYRESIKEFPIK
jgi:glycerol-3-phosphate dehydrogenase subunit C